MKKHPDYNFKIVLLGDAAVGKTSLVQRFVHDKFSTSYLMTIGMEPSEKFITLKDGTLVALSIWDLAGQDRFKFIRHTFFKGAKAAMIVFDLTRDSSLKNTEQWYQELYTNAGSNTVKVLVGNKNDLKDQISVSDKECKTMKEKIKCFDFIKTSALTGDAVNKAFEEMANMLVKQAQGKK